jgi:hypothetical protein
MIVQRHQGVAMLPEMMWQQISLPRVICAEEELSISTLCG